MNTPEGDRSAPEVTDVTLERFQLSELPAQDLARIEAHLRRDPALGDRLRAIERSDAETRQAYPAREMTRDVRRLVQLAAGPRRVFAPAAWLGPALAAAALVVAVLTVPWSSMLPAAFGPPAPDDRPKGAEAALFVYRNLDGVGQRLDDGDRARTGDLVRLGYRVEAAGYGAIVSVDGRGVLTRHLPDRGTRAVALDPGVTVLLDRAFELDDAPRVERFYLIAAPAPFDLQLVDDAVRAAVADTTQDPAPVQLPPGFTSTSFALRKDSRP